MPTNEPKPGDKSRCKTDDSPSKEHDFDSLVCIYAQLLPTIREAGKRLGYAIAIHGSMSRDLDLLAVPWVDGASRPKELVEAVREAVGGYVIGDLSNRGSVDSEPTKKPHGRLSWNICWGGRPFIDLSIMPPQTADLSAPNAGIAEIRTFIIHTQTALGHETPNPVGPVLAALDRVEAEMRAMREALEPFAARHEIDTDDGDYQKAFDALHGVKS